MILLILFLVSFFGFVLQSLATYHKNKFNYIDKFIFTVLLVGFISPILLLIFNFK